MNSGEARQAAMILSEMGHDIIPLEDGKVPDRAEAVILFTCDVISSTERRMWKRMAEIEESGKELYVAGCLASIEEHRIIERHPDAILLDTMGLNRLADSISEMFDDLDDVEGDIEGAVDIRRLDHIVPIASGCAGSCLYCITKRARGPHVSNTPDRIMDIIKDGIDRGKREYLITSQDTGAYGMDLDPRLDLGDLLRMITSAVPDDIRIRIGMMNPNHLISHIDSILDGFDDRRIFRFFHLPIQSGSNRILELMGRRYTSEGVLDLIRSIRERYPMATISTDLITGFPTETDEDHLSSLELLKEVSPDILNITRFSRREGTPANSMDGQVAGGISKVRSREFTRVHREIVQENLEMRMMVHRSCLVTESGREGTMMARDGNYTPIVIRGKMDLLGSFVDIETYRTGPTYLYGSIVN